MVTHCTSDDELVGHKHPFKPLSGIVATPTSCVFRLAAFGVLTGVALALGVHGPIASVVSFTRSRP